MKIPKILLVEDNSRISGQLRSLLEAMGLEVRTAATGIEGLLSFNKELPHLLILEQFLPLLSGEEVVSRIRKSLSPAELPVLMLVSSRFGGLSSSRRAEINLVLEKPLQAHTFQQSVQQVLQYSQTSARPKPLPGFQRPEHFYAMWGELLQTSLPVLLLQMREKKQTGLLLLTLQNGSRCLGLYEGELFYAESSIPEEQFPIFLKRRLGEGGALSQIDRMIAGSGARAILQREAMIRAGVLSELEINPLYRQYQENIVIRSLFLTQGSFQLIEDYAYVERVCTGTPIALLPILLEGVQHSYSPQKLTEVLSPYRNYLCSISPQYSQYASSLMQKFPSISFAPHRLSGRTIGHIWDEFSSNPQLNAQLVQTLLLARLISLTPPSSNIESAQSLPQQSQGISRAPAAFQTSETPLHLGVEFSQPQPQPQPWTSPQSLSQNQGGGWSTLSGSSSGGYRSSLPPSIGGGSRQGQHPSRANRQPSFPPTRSVGSTGQAAPNHHIPPVARENPQQFLESAGRNPLGHYTEQTGSLFPTQQTNLSIPSRTVSRPIPNHLTPLPNRQAPSPKPNRGVPISPNPAFRQNQNDFGMEIFEKKEKEGNFPSADPDFIRKLDSDFLRAQSDDYFVVMNVTPDVGPDEIRGVYRAFFQLYNPDRFKQEPDEDTRNKASALLRRISQACAVLSTPHARVACEAKFEQKKQQVKNRLVFSQEQFQQGEYFLKNNRFSESIPHFQRAIEANEKDPAFYLRLGWAIFRHSPNEPQRVLLARTYIEKALQMNPIFEDAYFYLGTIRRKQGANKEAIALFQRILLLNPGHLDAHRLLKELGG